MQTFGEGKYDNTVMKVRTMTNARHALTIILDGDRGSGFALHISGMTAEDRLRDTKRMVAAIAHIGRGLIEGIEQVMGCTQEQAMQDLQVNDGFRMEPSPTRCVHCGGTLRPNPGGHDAE